MSELPNGWSQTRLGEILEFKYGKSLPGKARVPGRYGVYGSNGPVGTHTNAITAAPAIIVGRKGSIGEVHFSETSCFPIDTTYFIDDFDVCTPRFAEYLLKSLPLSDLNRATAIPGLNRDDVYALTVALPPLLEQQRIATKLISLTQCTARARAELDHIPSLIAQYKHAVLSAALGGELTKEWRALTGSGEPRSANLNELVAEGIRNGLSVRGSDEPPGVRALRLSALRGGTVDLNDVRYLPITEDKARRFLLRDGDVLVSRGNGTKAFVGLAALVPEVGEPTIFPDTAFRIRLNPEVARADWFTLLWNAPQVRAQIERSAKTTAGIWKVSQADLAKIKLQLPPVPEQHEIVRRIEIAFGWLDRLAVEYEKARRLLPHLDQAIFAKAFRGELVPQNPDDEPVSLLLERIRAAQASTPKRGRKIRSPGAPDIGISTIGPPTIIREEQDLNKTRHDVPETHLCDIVKKSGGTIKTDALWRASEMQIDEFYKLLRDDVTAKRLSESKDKALIINAS
jgi:type I restriction enzyme S subunit